MARPKGSKNKSKISLTGSYTNGSMSGGSKIALGGLNKTANFSVTQAPTNFYSPELTTESWLLPKSRQEILKWVRIFFNLEPYIQKITMMHSRYPFSKFEITTPDKSITDFYTDMTFNKNFNMLNFILQASLSYQKFGEAICFGNMETDAHGNKYWSKFILLEPELVEIKQEMFSGEKIFELIPTDELKQLVNSTKPEDVERKNKLIEEAPEIVKAIQEKRNIELDGTCVSQIARITDPSATRGTSPIQACFKALIYQDWIRLAQSAYAQRYVFPIELWTIGDAANGIWPDDATLEKFRNIIQQAIQQPPFSLVFPPTVKYEPLSVMGKQFPVNNEYDYIQDQLMVALGVNKNILLGEGPSFSNVKTMALHALINDYKVVRDQFEEWMMYHFYQPIAEANDFYTTVGGKKKLILPQIAWHKSLDVEQEEEERQLFIELHKDGYISTETLYSKFPSLDYDAEQKKLERERGTIWDKGDDRLAGKIHKSVSGGPKGPSSGGGGGSMGMPPEPIEPVEPGEEGAEGLTEPGEETSQAPGDGVGGSAPEPTPPTGVI